MRRSCVFLLWLAWVGTAGEVVDRIAIVVDQVAIKQSDIFNDIRLTDFINGEKLEFSLPVAKQAASRLIDQAIIRKEIESGRYGSPDPEEVNQLWGQIRTRYRTNEAFLQALKNYGLTEEQLRERLRWQVTVLQFIDLRFGTGEQANSGAPNQAFFDWLNETRKQARIVFKEEALK